MSNTVCCRYTADCDGTDMDRVMGMGRLLLSDGVPTGMLLLLLANTALVSGDPAVTVGQEGCTGMSQRPLLLLLKKAWDPEGG